MGRAMHRPNSEVLGQGSDRERLAVIYRKYHRLVIKSYLLRLRMGGLRALVLLLSPFITPGLVALLHRWFDNLHDDVAEFSRMCRAFRGELRAQPRPFQNPWM